MSAKPDFIIVATGDGSMATFLQAAKTTGLADKIPFTRWGVDLPYKTSQHGCA
jgi:hypothetical protein